MRKMTWLAGMLVVLAHSAAVQANVVLQFLEHPVLANRSPGADYLWQTFDAGEGFLAPNVGDNDAGSSTFWHTDNPFGSIGFFRNTLTYSGTLPPAGGVTVLTALGVAGNTTEVYGAYDPAPGAPLAAAPPSPFEIFADQSIAADYYFVDGVLQNLSSTGWYFLPGDDPAAFVGAGALADHIDYLIDLAGPAHDAYFYFEGVFVDEFGSPTGLGSYSGFATASTVVPLPPAMLLLLTSLLPLAAWRRRALA